MYLTDNCVVCGKKATSWSCHVTYISKRGSIEHLAAGWCEDEVCLFHLKNYKKTPHCPGYIGRWKEEDGMHSDW